MVQLMGSHVGSSTTDPSAAVDAETDPEIDYLPEVENFDVQLKKDSQGLGITIAGYVCERGIYLSLLSKSAFDSPSYIPCSFPLQRSCPAFL